LVFLVPCSLLAQQRTFSLAAPDARLAIEFSELTTMRELADGRVLLFDRTEDRVVVADFRAGTIRDVARRGRGPGEFEALAVLLPLAGDTTIAAELSRRWLMFVGDRVVATLVADNPAVQSTALAPLGADHRGHVLSRTFRRSASLTDSIPLVLVDRRSGRADSIAALRNRVRGATMSPGQGRAVRIARLPLDVQEAALLFEDGSVAVARLEPYRVDWRSPEGRWTSGAPIPVRALRMTDRERKAYADRHPGFRSATDWPELLPPFDTPTSLFASPEGWLLVHRLPSADEPEPRYDVIDKSGTRRTQLVLRANEHVLGFGERSVYVVETDADGLQRLRRHPWPAAVGVP
jgi:hypothetical protein